MTEGYFDFAKPRPEELLVGEATFVAFDFETTGLYPERDRIIEIGAVRFTTVLGPSDRFKTFLDPGIPIPLSASEIHGITDDMVRGMPAISTVLPRFIDFIGDSTLVAHNINFDKAFLDTAMVNDGLKPLQNPMIDTCTLSRKVLKHHASYSLQALARDLQFASGTAHRAPDDAELARLLLLHIFSAIKNIESFTVAKLITFSNSRRKAYES